MALRNVQLFKFYDTVGRLGPRRLFLGIGSRGISVCEVPGVGLVSASVFPPTANASDTSLQHGRLVT